MKLQKLSIKTLVLVPLALLMMGNQNSCQQPPAVAHRQLKKIIELDTIQSRAVNLGAAGSFDFGFVANQQIVTVLMNSDRYAFRLQPPVTSKPISTSRVSGGAVSKISSVEGKSLNLSESDTTLMKDWMAQPSGKAAVVATESKEAWCLVNNPQAVLEGSVNSFEMLGGAGLTIGFTPSGDHTFSLIGANFQADFLQMDLSMHARSPLTYDVLASSDVTSDQTKTKISFGFNLGSLTLGPSFYYQTPLAAVTKKALGKAVDGLNKELDQAEWFTRVLADKDSSVVIVGGNNVNLKKGDELAIYNEVYWWMGEPCNSQMQYDGIAAQPVAWGHVDTVGRDVTIVNIDKKTEENVVIGAVVKLQRFAEDVPAPTSTPKPSVAAAK